MAGLEVLYTVVADSITCPQDAVVCLVHWELIKIGYKCLGSGDQAHSNDKRSELLPVDWNSNKGLYTLRYQGNNVTGHLLLKALTVDSTLIFNLMDSTTSQMSDLTVSVGDYVDATHLNMFDSVFKDVACLAEKVRTQLLPSQDRPSARKKERKSRRDAQEEEEEEGRAQTEREDRDRQNRQPRTDLQPPWSDPMAPFAGGGADLDPFGIPLDPFGLDPMSPFAGGGADLDPFRYGRGGMIVDPRSGFDPSGGVPDILPPGAVPPGARFDPFGPVGRPGPDPDHLPPPGYDDMFM